MPRPTGNPDNPGTYDLTYASVGRHTDCIIFGRMFLWEGECMRRLCLFSALGLALVLVVLGLGWSTPAHALQHLPSGTARLHTLTGGPGAQWTTSGASGGQLSYDANTGVATLTAGLDVLNWFDPNDGGCPTDVGSNCSFNYDPDLDISLDASFVGIAVSPDPVLGLSTYGVTLSFETTANALPDLTVSDPDYPGAGNVLEGNWTSGFFSGNPTTGLAVSVLFNIDTGEALFDTANSSGFLLIDSTTAYASLFESGSNYLGLNIASLHGFSDGLGGGLDELIAAAVATGDLPDFTAQGNGQVFRLTSSDFVVPEPTTALLLASGLALLGSRRSRS